MSAHQLLKVLAVWCALTCWAPAAVSAQAIFPVKNLTFGQLTRGVPLNVPPTDAARRAELDVTATGTFVMSWILPTHLRNAANNTLPITFSNTSGRVQWRLPLLAYNFDPKTPQTLWLPPLLSGGGAIIYLGGTAQPSPTQAPGVYTATMTLVIANAGT